MVFMVGEKQHYLQWVDSPWRRNCRTYQIVVLRLVHGLESSRIRACASHIGIITLWHQCY